MLNKNLDICKYNNSLISFKDKISNINIANSKWDFIFNIDKKLVFFNGFRLLENSGSISKTILQYSKNHLEIKDEYHLIFMEIDFSNIIINRNGISELWDLYEYPAFIFLDNENEIECLKKCCVNNVSFEEIAVSLKDVFIIYKSFELDVVWITGNLSQLEIKLNNE